jgi:hypothetical protein
MLRRGEAGGFAISTIGWMSWVEEKARGMLLRDLMNVVISKQKSAVLFCEEGLKREVLAEGW